MRGAWPAVGAGGRSARWGAKNAVLDFRALHGIEDAEHTMHDVDGSAAYFRKGRELPTFERARGHYLDSLAPGGTQARLKPRPPLTAASVPAGPEISPTAPWKKAENLAEIVSRVLSQIATLSEEIGGIGRGPQLHDSYGNFPPNSWTPHTRKSNCQMAYPCLKWSTILGLELPAPQR